MSQTNENYFESLPVGRLGIIPLESCKALGRKVDDYLVTQPPGQPDFRRL